MVIISLNSLYQRDLYLTGITIHRPPSSYKNISRFLLQHHPQGLCYHTHRYRKLGIIGKIIFFRSNWDFKKQKNFRSQCEPSDNHWSRVHYYVILLGFLGIDRMFTVVLHILGIGMGNSSCPLKENVWKHSALSNPLL